MTITHKNEFAHISLEGFQKEIADRACEIKRMFRAKRQNSSIKLDKCFEIACLSLASSETIMHDFGLLVREKNQVSKKIEVIRSTLDLPSNQRIDLFLLKIEAQIPIDKIQELANKMSNEIPKFTWEVVAVYVIMKNTRQIKKKCADAVNMDLKSFQVLVDQMLQKELPQTPPSIYLKKKSPPPLSRGISNCLEFEDKQAASPISNLMEEFPRSDPAKSRHFSAFLEWKNEIL